jgi:hypothetical protein
MSREMILDIDLRTGAMRLSVNGVSGPACKEFTRPIEEALGVVTSSVETPEYFEAEAIRLVQED